MYFYSAIQAVEWVGVLGLDFIIALANITLFRFLYQLLFSKRRFVTSSPSSSPSSATGSSTGSSTGTSFSAAMGSSFWPWILSVSIVAIWFSYGVRQFPQWEDAIEEWDTVTMGVVQPNEIPRIGKPFIYPGYSAAYPPEMDMTQRLASLGAELIVWPEAQIKGYFDAPEVRAAYQQSLQAMGSALLFQDMQRLKNSTDGALEKQYNTAVMLDKRGVEVGTYQKMKRMPFGEYLPMVRAGSDLEKWFKTLPGEFLNEIEEGAGHKLFEHEKVNIIPLICYETTFPDFVAEAVAVNCCHAKWADHLHVRLQKGRWIPCERTVFKCSALYFLQSLS